MKKWLLYVLCLMLPFAALAQSASPVAATVWSGTDSHGDFYEYHFQPNGELHYKSPSGFYKNGTWKQEGSAIYMETNNRFSERSGVIQGNRMEGSAVNIKGQKWTWNASITGMVTSVAGSIWAGTDSEGDYYEYHFQLNGDLHYKSPSGFYKNGTWRQDGSSIYMETNNRFSERKGTLRGTKMSGSASNVKGQKWDWQATPMAAVASVARTMWSGTDSQGDFYEYHFQSNGDLHYKSPSGFHKNGTWKQEGASIYMETNNRFSERKGTIRGNRMEGSAVNIRGEKWDWQAVKQ